MTTPATIPIDTVRQRPLEVFVPELIIDGACGLLEEHPHVRIYADVVRVHGRCHLPGKTLDLRARLIVSESGEIDVTGTAGVPDFDPGATNAELDGKTATPDGKPGGAGGTGNRGGAIEITAAEIRGALRLTANGGRGGNGQRGSNGAKPKAPAAGHDGSFEKAGKIEGWSKWGGKVLQGGKVSLYGLLQIAYGEPGKNGVAGGAAGAQGAAGQGGDGGSITVRVAEEPSGLVVSAEPGSAGAPGDAAEPGPGGDPGPGGRHVMEYWHLAYKYRKEYLDSLKHLEWARKDYKKGLTPTRASTGSKSGPKGAVPAPPQAPEPGAPGSTTVEVAAPAFDFPAGYREMLEAQVAVCRATGDEAGEQALQAWIEAVMTP